MRKWSQYWDWRVTYIEELKSQGQTDLTNSRLVWFFSHKRIGHP